MGTRVLGASTLVDLLRRRAASDPDRPAFIRIADRETPEASLSFAQLDASARRIAARLLDESRPGERALLLYPHGLEFISAFFGALYAGLIAVPAYPPRSGRSPSRLQAIAADARATLALTTDSLLSSMRVSFEEAPELKPLRLISTDNVDPPRDAKLIEPMVAAEGLAFLQYTSGSTGSPKGVMVSHANLMHNEREIHRAFEHTERSLIVSWLPLFHDMGLIGNVLQSVYAGIPCALLSPTRFLQEPLSWLQAISRYRATTSGGPNFAYDLCVERIRPEDRAALDLSGWGIAFNGAEPVRHETLRRFVEAFSPCGFRREAFYPCYGLAEATLFVSGGRRAAPPVFKQVDAPMLERHVAADPDPSDASRARTLVGCGSALDDQEIEIVHPDSLARSPSGEVGEIWVAGPSVARGYWEKPEETERTFRARLPQDGRRTFLRTGDLGFTRDGELFITGRLKDLIIIRGRNLYPQDIELTVERSHPAVRAGCVAAFSSEIEGEEHLVVAAEIDRRFLASEEGSALAEAVFSAIRREVAGDHEVAAYTVLLLKHGTIPKTTSGKIRRADCRTGYLTGRLSVVASSVDPSFLRAASASRQEPPRDAGEEILIGIWEEILGASGVGAHDDFFALGGDSLLAARLVARLRDIFLVDLPVPVVFEAPTPAALAARISIARGERPLDATPPLVKRGRRGEAPISFAQQRLWFLDQLDPGHPVYNIAVRLRMSGRLDSAILEASLSEIARRHESLRTKFKAVGGHSVQVIAEPATRPLPLIDLRHLEAPAREDELARLAAEEARRPFDLEAGPLWRATLVRVAEDDHVLLLTFHHIISDRWSLGILLHEISAIHASLAAGTPSSLTDPVIQYADYAGWERERFEGGRLAEEAAFWRAALDGAPALEVPADRPRPAIQTHRGGRCPVHIPAELAAKLKDLGRREGASLFMTLLSAWNVLLQRYSGQSDICVGTPVAGRSRLETEGLIGLFVNTLVLRSDLSGDPTFSDLLKRTRRMTLEALAHQSLPFECLVEALHPGRTLSRQPLFQVMFALQNTPMPSPHLPGVKMEVAQTETGTSLFDLSLICEETGAGILATLEYASDLFDPPTIARMATQFRALLQGIAAMPGGRISTLPLLAPEERQRLLLGCNATSAPFPEDRCLHEMVEAQVSRTPERVALVSGSKRISYRELDRRASLLAGRLRRLGVRAETPVGLCVDRTPAMVVGALGILKAGGAYVPLDRSYPVDRLAFMMKDAGVNVLVTQGAARETWVAAAFPSVELDSDGFLPGEELDPSPRGTSRARNLAYIIYTSGSTGRPKGVAIEHRSVVAFLEWARNAFSPRELGGVLASTSICFDLSVFEIFAPLTAGGTIVLAENVLDLADLSAASEVTLLNTVPSAIGALVRAGHVPGSVRTVCLAGEPLTRALAQEIYRLGHVERILNLYGPTEATTYATIALVERDEPREPAVGRPIANTQAYLLDSRLEPVPIGVPGEIFLGGEGIARGYLHRPDLTARAFIPDPFSLEPGKRLYRTGDLGKRRPDGSIDFLGRIDHQVKVRGFRIELGEIESILREHPEVREAVAVAREDPSGGKTLLAYLVPKHDGLAMRDLRAFLKSKLPDHMIPASLVTLSALPLTSNGKLDRSALPAPDPARPEAAAAYAAPSTATEKLLASIWSEILGLGRMGVHENFFDLGGDSILSLQIVARARSAGLSITPKHVFQHQTISDLAAAADAVRRSPDNVEPPVKGKVSLTPIQRWFFDQDLKAPHHWNQFVLFETPDRPDRGTIELALGHLVRHHDALRLRFRKSARGWRQAYDGDDVVVPLTYVDLTTLPPDRQKDEIESAAAEEQSRLDLSRGPLFRAAAFDLGRGVPGRLLLVAHHLVVDAVSWRILIEDLHLACAQAAGRAEVRLPARTASFGSWAGKLAELAGSGALADELAYWLESLSGIPSPLPVDHARGANLEASARCVKVSLEPAETRALLLARSGGSSAGAQEIILAALAATFVEWTGRRIFAVSLEGHGRDPFDYGMDLSRTVGWFTVLYPMVFDLRGADDALDAVSVVVDQFRRLPRKGIGYGLLRHLASNGRGNEHAEGIRSLRGMPEPEVSFNYLGRLDAVLPPVSGYRWATESGGACFSPLGERRHLIDVACWVRDGRLEVEWRYSENRHLRSRIESAAGEHLRRIRAILEGRRASATRPLSPSDFPDANLDQEQLDRILKSVLKQPEVPP